MIEHKNAIQMGHFANLAATAAIIGDGDRTVHAIGYITGKARGVSFRSNPNGGEPTLALNGIFEGVSTEAGHAVMVAPTVFLPMAFTKSIAAVLMGEKKWPDKAPPKGKWIDVDGTGEVELVLEIGIRKNSGAGVGYEFAVTQMNGGAEKSDALSELREFLPKEIAQHAAPKALPAPAKSAGKGKSKKK
jgi:hypothetical protein